MNSYLTWWEYKGKKKRNPNNLVYKKNGGLDRRYRAVKDFLADSRWVYRDILSEYWGKAVLENITKPRDTSNKGKIKFKRYGELSHLKG